MGAEQSKELFENVGRSLRVCIWRLPAKGGGLPCDLLADGSPLTRSNFALILLAATLFIGAPAFADDAPAKSDKKDEINLPPMSADRSIRQTINIGGRQLRYQAMIGHIDIRDAKGKTTGQVVYTAYTMPGAHRPVTFAFNGGLGAASVFLNMGAIGPKRVPFGDRGDSPSDSAFFVTIRRLGSTSRTSSS